MPGSASASSEHRSSGSGSERERDEALDALAVEHEPGHRREARERRRPTREYVSSRTTVAAKSSTAPAARSDARRARGAAQPERERHRDVAEERELVPVADGRPQPGDAAVVGVERGHALREQRPAEDERRAAPAAAAATAPSRGTSAESRKPSSAKAA